MFWRKPARSFIIAATELSANNQSSKLQKHYDDDHYCAMEFRCYVDDSASPKGFSYTLYDDC